MLEALSLSQLILAAVIITLAYFVRGIAGFGSGLIAIPLLAIMLPLSVAVPMIVLLDYLASASHGVKHRELIKWRELLPLLPFSFIGVVLALYLFKSIDAVLLSKSLGVFIILFALYTLANLAPKNIGSRAWIIPAGSLGGLVGTLFGTGGPFYVIYLKMRGLDKSEFRATFAMIFLLDGAGRLTGYLVSGFFHLETLLLLAAGLPMMIIGMYLGGHVHANITQQTFQRAISLLLIGSGLGLLLS